MGKTTLVRVPKGIALTETMLANLNNIFQQDVDIEYYSNMPDLLRSYMRRRDSLYDAFQFIIKGIPARISCPEINKYLDWCNEQSELADNLSINDYQAGLSKFTALLVNALIDYWVISGSLSQREHDAIELLNIAEQYVIMQKGRPDLATITTMAALKNGELCVQWEKQLAPCSAETLIELHAIKNSEGGITPQWFRELPFDQQLYLRGSESHRKTASLLKTDFNTLELQWKNIKTDVWTDLINIAAKKHPLPSWFVNLSVSHQALIQYWASLKINPIGIERHLQELGERLRKLDCSNIDQLEPLRKLPHWFLVLAEYEQRLLKESLLSHKNIEDAVSFIPSRLRRVPGLANFAEHHFLLVSKELQVLHRTEPRLRFSHITSRDVKKHKFPIGELHTSRNLDQIRKYAAEKPLLIQTLISPFAMADKMIPDGYLHTQLCLAVMALRETNPEPCIYLTNHPLNILKRVKMTLTGDVECNFFLTNGKPHLVNKEQNLTSGMAIKGDFLTVMVAEAIRFTRENSACKGYAELAMLMQKNPLAMKELSLNRLKELVKRAFIDAGIFLEKKISLEPLSPYLVHNDEDITSHKLTQIFMAHYNRLNQWKGWQPVLANYYYVLANDIAFGTKLPLITDMCDLEQIVCQYEQLLASGYGTGTVFDQHGRELWLASLENLKIILQKGISSGSCVSGKDRKALELIHTDAMILYRIIYGVWPCINDTGIARANFVELVASLYVSRHMHEHADQNAPGANGIKTPGKYFPADICYAICKKCGNDALRIDDIMATNNEVDRIGNAGKLLKPNYARCWIAAMKLCDESRSVLMEALKIIVENEPYWGDKKSRWMTLWGSSPLGIGHIKETLNSPITTSLESIANTFHIICSRPEESSRRADETQELYSCIMALCNAADPESLLPAALEQLKSMQQKISSSTCYS